MSTGNVSWLAETQVLYPDVPPAIYHRRLIFAAAAGDNGRRRRLPRFARSRSLQVIGSLS